MPSFLYEAISRDGAAMTGKLDAPSRAVAIRELGRRGLTAKALKPAAGAVVKESAPVAKDVRKKKPVNKRADVKSAEELVVDVDNGEVTKLKPDQLILFTEDLADFLTAGLPLEQSLHAMENQHASGGLRVICERLRLAITEGTSFGRALAVASPSFDELYCNLATAGEASGALAPILRRQAEYLSQMREMKRKVVSALIYPAFLIVAGVLVTALLMFYLMPEITSLLEDSGKKLPLGTQLLIGFSDFVVGNWWWLTIGFVIVVALAIAMWRNPAYKNERDSILLQIPLISRLQRAEFNLLFTETVANLIANGLPLLRAAELTRNATTNHVFREQLDEVIECLADGGSLSASMRRVGGFTPSLIDVAAVGESTGSLEKALKNAARRLRRDLDVLLERISALIQPVIITVMALVVGSAVYLMITAIFQAISSVNAG